MAKTQSSNLIIVLRQSTFSYRKRTHLYQTRHFIGSRVEIHKSINSNNETQFPEIAKQVCKTIRFLPRWENTLISDFPSLNVSNANLILEILKHQNNALLSFRFFQWLCSQEGFSADSETLNAIFDTLVKAKAWKAAKNVICLMKCPPEDTLAETYIKGLCLDGHMEEVLHGLSEFKRLDFVPTLSVWNTILLSCLRIGRTDLVWAFYGNMMEVGVSGDVVTVGYVIRAFCKEKKFSEAYELMLQVLESGHVPDVVAFSSLITGFCSEGNYNRVSELLHLMIAKNCMPDIFTYQGIIHGLCKNNMAAEAFRVFSDLDERGYTPDVVVYTTMIDGLCKMGRMEEAWKLWCEMIKKELVPNEYTYNVLIDGYCKMGNLVEAQRLYKEMCDRGYRESTVSHNIMIAGLCFKGKVEEAYCFFEGMVEKGINRDAITYSILIQGFCTNGKTVEAMNIYHKLLETDLDPLTSSYTPLIRALCKEGNVEEAIELLNDMLKRGVEPLVCTHDDIVTGFCEQGNATESMGWLMSMLRDKLKPQGETFNRLIECLILKNQIDDVMVGLDAMFVRGYILGESVCSLLVNRLCQQNSLQTGGCLEMILERNCSI